MKKILSILKKYIPSIILIIVLLVIQAYCDLELPDYTSNIIISELLYSKTIS